MSKIYTTQYINQFNEDCSKEKTRKVYNKRYKQNGEEYLKKIDEIDIEEDLKNKHDEINRIKELFNIQERLKAEELIDEMTNEEFLNEVKDLQNYDNLDTYEFLNKTAELQELYAKMPKEVQEKYKNLAQFSKEYIPQFIEKQTKKLEIIKENEKKQKETKTQEEINNEIQNQIIELQNQLEQNKTNEEEE